MRLIKAFLSLFQFKQMDQKAIILTLFFAAMYVSVSISCDPLFFRQTELFGITFTASSFLYAGLYAISDAVARVAGSTVAVMIVLFDKVSDGLYSYLNYFATKLPYPTHFFGTGKHVTDAVNTIGQHLPMLYYNGLFVSALAAVIEVLIFSKIYSKINNFFFATIFSTTITLLLHDIPSDYLTLRHLPNVWQIVWGNFAICWPCAVLITLLIWCIMKATFVYSKSELSGRISNIIRLGRNG